MLNIGCHLSSSKGFLAMGEEALNIKANTFQFFTRNPRGSKAKEINPEDARKLCELLLEHSFAKLLAHAPYTLNPCSAALNTREFAFLTMMDDLKRMEFLPNNMYNFHPGSHIGQ
ncbi:MAG: apurinic endonuclease Apn1, partial [Herbinix sp.]|nr:apurinic endonuclease Apn1 [Herbinix sp.]